MSWLAWSLDSTMLFSSGTMASRPLGPTILRSWRIGSNPTFSDKDLAISEDDKFGVDGIVPTSSGCVFVSGSVIGFNEQNGIRILEPSSGLGQRRSIENIANGLTVYFEYPQLVWTKDHYFRMGESYSFSVLRRSLQPQPNSSSIPIEFHSIDEAPGMDIEGLLTEPTLNGVHLEVDSPSKFAYTFTPDSQHLLLGTLHSLYRFDRNGSQIWKVGLPASANGVNVSRDGRMVLVLLADGTIRWYRLLDGKELAVFYALNDRHSWAMWTPDGYFDTSEGGTPILAQGVVRPDGLIDAEPLSLSSPFHRPDKINEALTNTHVIEQISPISAMP